MAKKSSAKSAKPLRPLSNVVQLSRTTITTLWNNRGLFLGITGIYTLLNLLLIQGLTDDRLVATVQGSKLDNGLNGFFSLMGSAGGSNNQASYQFFIIVIVSLATIWALRQIMAGTTFRIRDAFYKGMYPLVPFILVMVVIGLQLIPLLIGATLYNVVIANEIAITVLERTAAALVFAALGFVSLYFVSSSLFALYIAALPDMTPKKALNSAKELVRGRRWQIIRKVLYLPCILLFVTAIIVVPLIIIAPVAGQWAFFLLTMLGLVVAHGYMYTLYRELINE